ncbi:hypothetical protein FA13DRAFT_1594219, partial [Coprinellus micaceus]
ILSSVSSEFSYDNPSLDGLMLDKRGIHCTQFDSDSPDDPCDEVTLCNSCASALAHSKVPQMALMNHLYCGHLPDEFSDLTWVEEMACAIYRNTAHVTRLFNSASEDQPKVLHGNTCVHEMNVVSTARVLPRTPADINGMLTVVFIGPKKEDAANSMETMFRVRKKKIGRFLRWLSIHNRLYRSLPFDESILEQFPDDGPLPGICDAMIHHK